MTVLREIAFAVGTIAACGIQAWIIFKILLGLRRRGWYGPYRAMRLFGWSFPLMLPIVALTAIGTASAGFGIGALTGAGIWVYALRKEPRA